MVGIIGDESGNVGDEAMMAAVNLAHVRGRRNGARVAASL